MALISKGGIVDLNSLKISWCIGIQNRILPRWKNKATGKIMQRSLFGKNIKSLLKLQNERESWEFCVADYGSTDANINDFFVDLHEKFPNNKFTHKIKHFEWGNFTRGGARQEAYKLATHDTIFFLDADMMFGDRQVIDNVYKNTTTNYKVYFPICASYNDPEHTSFTERPTGYGNFSVRRSEFDRKKSGWQKNKKWGNEDTDMFKYFNGKKLAVRDYTKTFFHQWHPQPGMSNQYCKDKNWELIK